MKLDNKTKQKIIRDGSISIFLYALPVFLMFLYLSVTHQQPWLQSATKNTIVDVHSNNVVIKFIESIFRNLSVWGLPVLILTVGTAEFALGLYDKKWTKNELYLDITCFIIPRLIVQPTVVFFSLKLLPLVLPGLKNEFAWVPFGWAFLIIAVADDLTQYWYHRLHHQVPFLWRFHRTHHSAPYMGMSMASRQNIIYTIFFSQIYLTAALVYLGLGYAALFVTGIKSLITLAAHSSIPWDKPFYKYKLLRPVGWVLERVISTPATHQAHHADTTDDGVGNYKGNFGNMFFIWDIIFKTGIITRRYPTSFGIKHYKQEEWYAQFLWPIFKSKKEGSELHARGPVVGDAPELTTEVSLNKEKFENYQLGELSS